MKTMRLLACGALITMMSIGCGAFDTNDTIANSDTDGTIASANDAISSVDVREAIEDACRHTLPNHGACVSCVAQAVNEARSQGVITGQQGGQIVSEFARGFCKGDCIPTTCGLGQCNLISDGCGGEVLCDPCPLGQVCTEDSVCCVPDPLETTCGARQCGDVINNCGRPVSCGTCPEGSTCVSGPVTAFCVFD
jgi:hypothetical protein